MWRHTQIVKGYGRRDRALVPVLTGYTGEGNSVGNVSDTWAVVLHFVGNNFLFALYLHSLIYPCKLT